MEVEEKKLCFIVKENIIWIVNFILWYMSLILMMDDKKSIGDIMVVLKIVFDVLLICLLMLGVLINYVVINDFGNWW